MRIPIQGDSVGGSNVQCTAFNMAENAPWNYERIWHEPRKAISGHLRMNTDPFVHKNRLNWEENIVPIVGLTAAKERQDGLRESKHSISTNGSPTASIYVFYRSCCRSSR